MSWTKFVKNLFVYLFVCLLLEPFGTIWKRAREFEFGVEIEFDLNWKAFAVFFKRIVEVNWQWFVNNVKKDVSILRMGLELVLR